MLLNKINNMKRTNILRNPRTLTVDTIGYLTEKSFTSYIRVLSWIFSVDAKPLQVLRSRIQSLVRKNGKLFTVLYLKESVRLFQHYLAGQPQRLSVDTVVGLSGGIPTIIPGSLRLLIKAGDQTIIRVVFSILSCYRIMKVPGKLKINSITDPFRGIVKSYDKIFIEHSVLQLLQIGNIRSRKLSNIELHRSSSAGPNYRTSLIGCFLDLAAWGKSPVLLQNLKDYIFCHPNGDTFWNSYLREDHVKVIFDSFKGNKDLLTLGKLHFKDEPAGKIRVFAITDMITQSVMKPLHTWIFAWLRKLPMDGTFDQIAPIKRLQSKLLNGEFEGNKIWSYDLSSATDRLPLQIQVDILSSIFGSTFATSWGKLLTDRDWSVPCDVKSLQLEGHPGVSKVKYEVGQPMGALSSWGMLALTHHVIVGIAARRVGKPFFTDYAVLGDDIVIANDLVASAYHTIMCDELGVEISTHKSLVSSNSFEFAKQLIRGEDNLSPLGPKNVLLSIKSKMGMLSLFIDMNNKGVVIDEPTVTELVKKSPFMSNKRREDFLWTVKGPFGIIPTQDGLTSSMKLVSSLTPVRISSLLHSIDSQLHIMDVEEHWKNVEALTKAYVRLINWKFTFYFSTECHSRLQEIHDSICELFLKDLEDMKSNPPIRKYVFDGPIIHFNYYREGYGKEIVAYISQKIDRKLTTLPIMDPFEFSEKVALPWKFGTRGEDFFSEVRKLEQIKDQERLAAMED